MHGKYALEKMRTRIKSFWSVARWFVIGGIGIGLCLAIWKAVLFFGRLDYESMDAQTVGDTTQYVVTRILAGLIILGVAGALIDWLRKK